eukprot:6208306-Pleurochrysis_carterae.AAC.5
MFQNWGADGRDREERLRRQNMEHLAVLRDQMENQKQRKRRERLGTDLESPQRFNIDPTEGPPAPPAGAVAKLPQIAGGQHGAYGQVPSGKQQQAASPGPPALQARDNEWPAARAKPLINSKSSISPYPYQGDPAQLEYGGMNQYSPSPPHARNGDLQFAPSAPSPVPPPYGEHVQQLPLQQPAHRQGHAAAAAQMGRARIAHE